MNIGQFNRLQVMEHTDEGLILGTEDSETVLLPHASPSRTELQNTSAVGQWLEVFVYSDARGEPIVTRQKPLALVGEFALLKVVSRSSAGIWLDWGLPNNLLLPVSEQSRSSSESSSPENSQGDEVVFVLVFLDDNDRVCASTRWHRHLDEEGVGLKQWQPVSLIIAAETDLGFKAIIDDQFLGLLYADEVFQPLNVGDRLGGYIKTARPDGKIDLTLYPKAAELKDELGQRILAWLWQHGGESTLTDQSPPEDIYQQYQVSKKNYKKAVGNLYKARKIQIHPDRIVLAKKS